MFLPLFVLKKIYFFPASRHFLVLGLELQPKAEGSRFGLQETEGQSERVQRRGRRGESRGLWELQDRYEPEDQGGGNMARG